MRERREEKRTCLSLRSESRTSHPLRLVVFFAGEGGQKNENKKEKLRERERISFKCSIIYHRILRSTKNDIMYDPSNHQLCEICRGNIPICPRDTASPASNLFFILFLKLACEYDSVSWNHVTGPT
jgi:hypothetical protein